MKYIEYINSQLQKETAVRENLVIFGQNVAAGSHISGMTKNLRVGPGGLILNVTNSENTLANLGFGMMLGGVSSIFFMKQQDFLLLGIDPLVNTYNFIRRKIPGASYTIFFIVVDSGYQGLQSSLNNFGDFCSMARVDGFTIQTKADAEAIIASHLVSPGFRIIGISQRMFQQEIIDLLPIQSTPRSTLFQYFKGSVVTIACFNFSLPYGLALKEKMAAVGVSASLFSVNAVTPVPWDLILEDAKRTGNLVVIDDSKSENLACENLAFEALNGYRLRSVKIVKRSFSKDWLSPQRDDLSIEYDSIIAGINTRQMCH